MRPSHRVIQFGLAAILFSLSFSAEAQQPTKVARIGFLNPNPPATVSTRMEAFRQGPRDLGYMEGKNFTVEYRHADGKAERLPDLAAELVRTKLDLIVTSSTPSVWASQKASPGARLED